MLQDLKTLLNRNEDIEEEQMLEAAYALLNQQFLRHANSRQRKQYEIICRFHAYFSNLAEASGYELIMNEGQGYVGVTPRFYSWRMKLDETLFLLVLRQLYDEEINAFHANDDATVSIPLDDLELRYKQLTSRELARTRTEFDQLSDSLRRRGILCVDNSEENPQLLYVTIYPTITAVVNSKAIDTISLYLRAEGNNVAISTEESEET